MEMETPPWDAHKQQADQDRNLCLYCAYTLLQFIISYFEKHFRPNHCILFILPVHFLFFWNNCEFVGVIHIMYEIRKPLSSQDNPSRLPFRD